MTTYAFPITIVVQANGDTAVTGASQPPATPVNTTLPTSTGTPQVGIPFTFTRGVWSNNPTTYTEQVNAAGTPISGANSLTYTPGAADVGKALTITENASNGTFGTAVTSLATPAVIAAAPVVAWVFSGTDKSAQVALTNTNHTATHTGTNNVAACVRGTVSKTAGKWHFEAQAVHVGGGNCAIGIASAAAVLTGFPGGSTSIVWYDDGSVWFNGVKVAQWAAYVANNILAIEFDQDAKTFKGKVGAGAYSTSVAYTALTGAVFPITCVYATSDAFIAVAPTLAITSGFSVLS